MTDEELKAIEERAAKALDLAWRAIVRVRAGEPDGGALARAHAALDATMVQRDVPRLLKEVRRLRAAQSDWIPRLLRLLQSAVFVGRPAPVVQKLQEAMGAEPKPGDLVFEATSLWRGGVMGVGVLVEQKDEPIKGWDDPGEPAPTERVWYIDALDGVRRRWTNALFHPLPTSMK